MGSLPINYSSKALWAVISILWLSIVSALAFTEKQCNFESIRLPGRFKPTHYDLLLKLSDLDAPTYEGLVKINVTIGQLDDECPRAGQQFLLKSILSKRLPFGCDKGEIVLNANSRVEISEASFILETENQTYNTIKSDEICRDEKNEMASIHFKKRLQDNSQGQLIIDFRVHAGVNQTGDGLYKSLWEDSLNKRSYLSVVTQFEAASARKALPCFDEPIFKSTFDVTIEHEKHLTALSNTMPIKEESVEGNIDLVRTHFERTPIMSTYLLAFTVGQYEHLESKIMDEKLLMRVFTPPGRRNMGRIALDIGRRAYAALHQYFDIEQPLEKIDLLAQKIGFGSAMENWGLVTFKEDIFLIDGDQAKDTPDIRYLAVTISHELAHHWFGNLVTMKWWDNLWLKEAFAQWLGYTMVDQIHPEFNMKIDQVENVQMVGLHADESPYTHAMKNPNLKTIREIEKSFDDITYCKGASILRMLEGHIGHETFKLAIRDYLNQFKYKNTDEVDLWNALQARSQLPVARMMDSWLNQAGFPLVSVQFTADKQGLHLRQDRFKAHHSLDSQRQLWMIPINMVVVQGDQPGVDEPELIKIVLSDREQEIRLPEWFDASQGHWLKLNDDAQGFFRVHYDPEVLKLMEKPIKSKQMDVIDRINVLDDLRALRDINKLDQQTLENFMELFSHDDSPAVLRKLDKIRETFQELSQDDTEEDVSAMEDFLNELVEGEEDGHKDEGNNEDELKPKDEQEEEEQSREEVEEENNDKQEKDI